jgi:hypothetical protein
MTGIVCESYKLHLICTTDNPAHEAGGIVLRSFDAADRDQAMQLARIEGWQVSWNPRSALCPLCHNYAKEEQDEI